MKKRVFKITGILLSLILVVMLLPAGRGWAEEMDRVEDTTEAAEGSAASGTPLRGTNDGQKDSSPKQAQTNDVEDIIDEDIANGKIEPVQEGNVFRATPNPGYDLATVRLLHSDGSEEYINYEKGEGGTYTFTIDQPDEGDTLTAFFFSLEQWDGAVDLTWYDPAKTSFDVSTPAQLAGVAAITNGMVDQNNTEEWMIKDNAGRIIGNDGSITHQYMETEKWNASLLTPNTGSTVTDTVWRLPEHEATPGMPSDDCYHDFRYRTVHITADIDMTDEAGQLNWTPIGGKYAMNPQVNDDGVKAKVIDTRFQGVFDGHGHTITIHCDRYSRMGFAYSWAVGLIGYLGGGVDYLNGYPKDTFVEYKQKWVPTARNLVVRGDVRGRRMAGGVVGRTGETNYGVVVEKCVNYATIDASDMRGCAGIVAAAWGDTVIRQCYNAGTINSAFSEHGGIVGCNGYEGSGSYVGRKDFRADGADIYDCFDIGEHYIVSGQTKTYDGHEIGIDGTAFAKYTVVNCYYLTDEDKASLPDYDKKKGYCIGEGSVNTRAKCRNVTAVTDMTADDVLNGLNQNGNVFVPDSEGINDIDDDGISDGPVLYFQTEAYKTGGQDLPDAQLTVAGSEHGQVTASDTGQIAYGTTVVLSVKPEKKYSFRSYQITDGDGNKAPEYGDFYTVTGQNVTIGARFEETSDVTLTFAEQDAPHVHYYVEAEKVWDADSEQSCKVALHSKDKVAVGDHIRLVPYMKKTFINSEGEKEPVHPDIKDLEYSGDISNLHIDDPNALEQPDKLKEVYIVTGEADEINIEYSPVTQGKRWTSIADTSWYKKGVKSFDISTAGELAGAAYLCNEEGVSFKGVTIRLKNDISLENTIANSGDRYASERSWIGIGTDRYPFEGIFEGGGHTIRYMTRNYSDGYCPAGASPSGLFGATDHAVIRNVTVEGGSYENADADSAAPAVYQCLFREGAHAGSIVGDAIDTAITNCHSSLNIERTFMSGGIVGTSEGATTITDCSYSGTISASNYNAGGIVGQIEGSGTRIERCVNRGSLISKSYNVGGIVGTSGTGKSTVNRCINEGDIAVTMKGSTSRQKGSAGGILGYAGGVVNCTESVNKGSVSGENRTFALGGIAGAVSKATIKDCYNMGAVQSNSSHDSAQIAGIANLDTSNANQSSLINCYNAGPISVGDEFVSSNKGGIAGYGKVSTNTISNCYCSASSVAQIGNTAGIAGTVLTDYDMQRAAGRLGAGFVADANRINEGYPVLLWQDPNFIGGASLSSVARSSDTSIVVSWSGWGNCTGYQVYQSTSAGGTYSKVGDVPQGSALNLNVTGLAYGLTYYYRVLPYRVVDGAVYYGAWTSIGSASLMPDTVTLTSVKNKKSRTAVLKWKRVSGAGGYQIYRSMKPNKGFKKIATIKKGKTVTYKNKKLKKGKKYYYKVRAYKKVGKRTGYGAFSATRAVKIKR